MTAGTETYDQHDALVFARADDSDLPYTVRRLGKATKVSIYYSDVNAQYTLDDQGLIVYDAEAINRQIDNILSTPLGSQEFEPNFGSLLPFRLFDSITPTTAYLIRNDTIDAIGRWMAGRITMDIATSTVSIINDNADYEGYIINMRYGVNKTNTVATYSRAYVR